MLNGLMAVYTAARVCYSLAYLLIETERLSYVRSFMFWVGNLTCVRIMVLAGRKM